MPAHFTFTSANQIASTPQDATLSGVTLQFADGTSQPAAPALVEALTSALAGFPNGATVHVSVDGDYVTPERAAQLLGVSRPTVYLWQDTGRIGRVQVANRRMVPRADITRENEEWEAGKKWAQELIDEVRAHPDPEAQLRESIEFLNSLGPDDQVDTPAPF